MITLTNVLTNERWDLPDAINSEPLHIGRNPPWPPGDYSIRNGSTGELIVVYDNLLTVRIPAGRQWAVSSNENLYSWYPVGVDFAANSSIFRGQWWAGWAPVAPVGNI